MKKVCSLLVIIFLFTTSSCLKSPRSDPWSRMEDLLSQIEQPSFPDRNFNVLIYGAIGDGKRDNSDVIRKAIEDCNAAGGGRVVIPEGTFACGPIYLKANDKSCPLTSMKHNPTSGSRNRQTRERTLILCIKH